MRLFERALVALGVLIGAVIVTHMIINPEEPLPPPAVKCFLASLFFYGAALARVLEKR